MNIQVRIEGQRGVLTLNGPLTQDSRGALQEQIDDLLRRGFREFVLEIAGVPYIDSNGLGQLVHAYKTIKTNGAHLQIVGVTGRMHELVSLVTPGESVDPNAPAASPDPVAPRRESRGRTLALWFAFSVTVVVLLLLIAKLALGAPRVVGW